jgi:hypothetical protein
MSDSPRRSRPSVGAIFTNWNEYDAPAHVKFRLALKNSWRRFRYASNCCGNHGEPGC